MSKQCPGIYNSIFIHLKPDLMVLNLVRLPGSRPSGLFFFFFDKPILDDIISNISYIPPVPHSRPTTFQMVLNLPAQAAVRMSMEVTKAFLRYTEHPPDAQRGWDLPPAIIITPVFRFDNGSDDGSMMMLKKNNSRIYTSALLVDLATPDFSMPYNVIIFTCSLMAFIFGSVFNLLTRKFVVVRFDRDQIQ